MKTPIGARGAQPARGDARQENEEPVRRRNTAGTHTAAWVVLLALLRRRLMRVTVHGHSMRPTLTDQQRVLAVRGAPWRCGQVVVVERPDVYGRWSQPPLPPSAGAAQAAGRQWMVKRIVAVAGDPAPPCLETAATGDRIPPDSVVVLGDNRADSFDSRQFGPVPRQRIWGPVVKVRPRIPRRPARLVRVLSGSG